MSDSKSSDSNGSAPRPVATAWIILAALMGLAFALRVLHVISTAEVPTVRHLIGDAASYFQWGKRIAAGDWWGKEGFYQAPLYPYFLGVSMSVLGSSILTIRVVQAFLGAVSVASLFWATGRWFAEEGQRRATAIGATAGMMLAVYGPAIYFDGIVQKATLECLLTCILLAAISWARDSDSRGRKFFLGLVLGLLCLARENALIWLPILGLWIALNGGKDTVRRSIKPANAKMQRNASSRSRGLAVAIFFLGCVTVLGPNAIRNRMVSGEWALTTFQAGPNFYIGNHRGADGRYLPLVAGHESPEFERADAIELAQNESGRSLGAREVSQFWMRKGLSEIAAEPLRWLKLLAYKLALTWNRYEVADAESSLVYAAWSPVLRITSYFHFGVVCPLAVIGLAWGGRSERDRRLHIALISAMSLSVAAFYVLARYRFPLVPLLMLFAAKAPFVLLDQWRTRAWRRLIFICAIGALAAILVNVPIQNEKRLDAMAWMNAGVSEARNGEVAQAEKYFRRCLGGFAESAECSANLAMALAVQGRFSESIDYYRSAIAADLKLTGLHFNLGVALENVGDKWVALQEFEKALAENARDAEAAQAVARLRGELK